MVLDSLLYGSLVIFILGSLFRMSGWFRHTLTTDGKSGVGKLKETFTGVARTVFSLKIVSIFTSFVLDGLLQVKTLKTNPLRWVMHFSIFSAFMMLVIFHVFDETITASFFPEYASTLNPFMFLRNLFGVMVLGGLAIAFVRRLSIKTLRRFSGAGDYFLIGIIGVIILSGFFLESAKIVSEAVYDDMISEYSDLSDEEEEEALKALWAKEYQVVFADPPDITDEELLETAVELNEDNCTACHSRPDSAFGSFMIVKALKPLAPKSNKLRADRFFFYIHYLATLLALALLPFTKAFHFFSTPLSLLLSRLNAGSSDVKRMVELDACIHCGACTQVCSVGPIETILKTETILPSEKLAAINGMVKGKGTPSTNEYLLSGSIVCTDCYRCNEICPAGIDLRDIWFAANQRLKEDGHLKPSEQVTEKTMHEWGVQFESRKDTTPIAGPVPVRKIIDDPEFFSPCVQCTTCANVCPVTAMTDGSSHDAGMSPQQVMNFLRLEMRELADVAGIVWNCTTCFQCQEHCPQEIPVADILCELRIQGFKKLRSMKSATEEVK